MHSWPIDLNTVADPGRVVDAETGIVRWISEIPSEPGEPEIFNFSVKMCNSARLFPLGCFDSNGGAGLTREAAYRASLGEAVERYCSSVFFPDELELSSLAELSRHRRTLRPSEVALFHDAQRSHIRYTWFDDLTPLAWTEAWSLTRREPILVPASLVFVPYYPFQHARGERTIAPGISTGQASALSYAAAMLGGLCEVIERDAFMIGWLHRLPLTRIVIDSSGRVAEVYRDRFARPWLHYHLFKMVSDIEVPTILCILIDDSRDPPMICVGGAANLDPEHAALKAMTEAVQTRQWAIFMGTRNEPVIVEPDYSNIDDFERHVFLYAYGDMLHTLDFLFHNDAEMDFAAFGGGASGDPVEDLRRVVTAVEGQGLEVMLVDLTTSDVAACGYRVVKMMVPLMQPLDGDHRHRFLGGTRLQTVPAKLGFRVGEIRTVNPYPHPYP